MKIDGRCVLEEAVATSEGVRFPRWLLVSIGIVGLGLAIYALRGVLTPIFFAFLIAYLLDPLVDRFEARGLPRALGIVVLLALTLGAMVVGALVLVPMVVREVVAFAHELPEKLEGLRRAAEPLLTSYGIPVPHSFEDLRQLVETGSDAGEIAPTDLAGRAATVMGTAAGWIWGRTASVLAEEIVRLPKRGRKLKAVAEEINLERKIVCLYFGAPRWCGPCRGFSQPPKDRAVAAHELRVEQSELQRIYEMIKGADEIADPFEFVYCCLDDDVHSFEGFATEMPGLVSKKATVKSF